MCVSPPESLKQTIADSITFQNDDDDDDIYKRKMAMVIGWGVLHTEMNENVSICPDGGRSFFEGVGGNDMGA